MCNKGVHLLVMRISVFSVIIFNAHFIFAQLVSSGCLIVH